MSRVEHDLREAERRHPGTPRHLIALVRSGLVTRDAVVLAAGLGHPVALLLEPDAAAVSWRGRFGLWDMGVIHSVAEFLGSTLPARFAADVAEHVLPIWESYPHQYGDDSPRRAIEATRAWVSDPTEENRDLALVAGRAAQEAASRSLDQSAINAGESAGQAGLTPTHIAQSAHAADRAADAVESGTYPMAMREAAWEGEQSWQRHRLSSYLLWPE